MARSVAQKLEFSVAEARTLYSIMNIVRCHTDWLCHPEDGGNEAVIAFNEKMEKFLKKTGDLVPTEWDLVYDDEDE